MVYFRIKKIESPLLAYCININSLKSIHNSNSLYRQSIFNIYSLFTDKMKNYRLLIFLVVCFQFTVLYLTQVWNSKLKYFNLLLFFVVFLPPVDPVNG